MHIAVTILHVLVCIGLILVVLLQAGKGANMGAVFGGSSQTIFGSSGPGTFLGKMTTAHCRHLHAHVPWPFLFCDAEGRDDDEAGHRPTAPIQQPVQRPMPQPAAPVAAMPAARSRPDTERCQTRGAHQPRREACPAGSAAGTGKVALQMGRILILTKKHDHVEEGPLLQMIHAEVVESGRHAILRG